jgi:dephospho-CoA kinase
VDGLVAVRPARVGLTGGIGSGKSTAAGFLQARGALIVDTDAIARALTQAGGAAMPELAAEFGPEAVSADGALAREHMRQLAFADAGVKARLEAILHPLIGREALCQAAAAGSRPVFFDVPLLAESRHWRARVDRVLVVDCDEATQVARVARRPGWSSEAARRVVEQQATRAMRRAIADAVICNDGLTLEQFDAEVGGLWALWFGPGT